MKYELKRVGLWSLVKISFILNLVVGFFIGLLAGFFMFMMMSAGGGYSGYPGMQGFDQAFSGVFLFIMPIIYAFGNAVFGTMIVVVCGGIYNLSAGLLGGVELTLKGQPEADDSKELIARDDCVAATPSSPISSPLPPPPPPPIDTPSPPPLVETEAELSPDGPIDSPDENATPATESLDAEAPEDTKPADDIDSGQSELNDEENREKPNEQ